MFNSTANSQFFNDISTSSGAGVSHTSNTYGVGQAWIDVNNDGLQDIYVSDQLGPNHLLINQGDETFIELSQYDNLKLVGQQCVGVSVADYNNDGWDDIYVNCLGGNHLFKSNQGTSFTDTTAIAGVGDSYNSQVSAWADVNNDGWLDLYVVNYSDGNPLINTPIEDAFYFSNGDGTFTNISSDLNSSSLLKQGLAVTFFDYDNDGDQDLYVVEDKNQGNVLWRNDGPATPTCGVFWCFTDVSTATNAGTQVNGMGIATGDIDNDGDYDLYFSSIGNQVLLINQLSQGSQTFVDVSSTSVLNVTGTAGWGTAFFDYDNDKYLDAMIATYGSTSATSEKLFKGNGDTTFVDVTQDAGITDNIRTEGVAIADFNNDGLLDILKANRNSSYVLYQNTISNSNNWIELKLIGGFGINQNALGSKVSLVLSSGETLLREVTSGDARGAGNQRVLHFGLGSSTVSSMTVLWPNGDSQIITSYNLNAFNTLEYETYLILFANSFE